MAAVVATIISVCVVLASGLIVAISRHKKSGTAPVKLVGLAGIVQTQLAPDGTVLIQGGLWPACSSDSIRLSPGSRVKVIETRDHLLVVKLLDQ